MLLDLEMVLYVSPKHFYQFFLKCTVYCMSLHFLFNAVGISHLEVK